MQSFQYTVSTSSDLLQVDSEDDDFVQPAAPISRGRRAGGRRKWNQNAQNVFNEIWDQSIFAAIPGDNEMLKIFTLYVWSSSKATNTLQIQEICIKCRKSTKLRPRPLRVVAMSALYIIYRTCIVPGISGILKRKPFENVFISFSMERNIQIWHVASSIFLCLQVQMYVKICSEILDWTGFPPTLFQHFCY